MGDDEVWEGMDEGTQTDTKMMLDDMHKSKIDMADEIFVVNPDGYIGESTWSEICYARMLNKTIRELEPLSNEAVDTKVKEHIGQAEFLAGFQLNVARHERYIWMDPLPGEDEYLKDGYVGFMFEKQLILDPWISKEANAHGDSFSDHHNKDEAVEPFEYYGKEKMARFVENINMYSRFSPY